ncbi:protein LBH [Pholidichthys leucotaenia]
MTNEVMNTCGSVVGGASGEEAVSLKVIPDSMERNPKLSRRLPSIVVEPMDGGDVESGELRWPPDDFSDDVTHVTGGGTEGAEPQEQMVHGVQTSWIAFSQSETASVMTIKTRAELTSVAPPSRGGAE